MKQATKTAAPTAPAKTSPAVKTKPESKAKLETQAKAPAKIKSATEPKKASAVKRAPDTGEIQTMIATAAYYRAQKRDFMEGFEQEDWLMAEQEINQLLSA